MPLLWGCPKDGPRSSSKRTVTASDSCSSSDREPHQSPNSSVYSISHATKYNPQGIFHQRNPTQRDGFPTSDRAHGSPEDNPADGCTRTSDAAPLRVSKKCRNHSLIQAGIARNVPRPLLSSHSAVQPWPFMTINENGPAVLRTKRRRPQPLPTPDASLAP